MVLAASRGHGDVGECVGGVARSARDGALAACGHRSGNIASVGVDHVDKGMICVGAGGRGRTIGDGAASTNIGRGSDGTVATTTTEEGVVTVTTKVWVRVVAALLAGSVQK